LRCSCPQTSPPGPIAVRSSLSSVLPMEARSPKKRRWRLPCGGEISRCDLIVVGRSGNERERRRRPEVGPAGFLWIGARSARRKRAQGSELQTLAPADGAKHRRGGRADRRSSASVERVRRGRAEGSPRRGTAKGGGRSSTAGARVGRPSRDGRARAMCRAAAKSRAAQRGRRGGRAHATCRAAAESRAARRARRGGRARARCYPKEAGSRAARGRRRRGRTRARRHAKAASWAARRARRGARSSGTSRTGGENSACAELRRSTIRPRRSFT